MATLIDVRPIQDWVFVDIYDDGQALQYKKVEGTNVKLWMPGDDTFGTDELARDVENKHPGIRPRWAIVLATNERVEKSGIKCGDKVLLDTLKWTRSVVYDMENDKKCWGIKVDDILMVDEDGFTEDELEILAIRYAELG